MNKNLFDRLQGEKSSLEAEFGEKLEWERLDNRRASRIAVYKKGTIDEDSAALDEGRRWSIDRLLRFKRVFGPRLRELMALSK